MLQPSTGFFSWSPGFDQQGSYEIEFLASDQDDEAREQLTIEVLNVNGPVTFQQLNPFVITEGQTFAVRIAAQDPDSPVSSLTPIVFAQDPNIELGEALPVLTLEHGPLPDGAEFDPEDQVLGWIPNFDQAGQYSIDFTVTDDGDGTGVPTSDTLTVEIEVLNANGTPIIEQIENQFVDVDATIAIAISGQDPDGEAVTLSVEDLPGFAVFTDNGDGTASIDASPTPGDRGNYVITVRASDMGGGDPEWH